MREHDLRQRLERALSSLEVARATASEDPAPGRSQVRKAQQALDAVRTAIARQAADRAKALRTALAEQERLVDQLTAGAIAPREANERNRRLASRLRDLRREIAELNALATAETPPQATGQVERPPGTPTPPPPPPRPKIDLKPTPLGFCLWILVLLAAIAAPLAYRGFVRFGPPLRIEARLTDTGAIRVVCRNQTPLPVALDVPWLDEASSKPGLTEGSKRYGIVCRIREHGADDFRLIIPPLDAWIYSGIPLRAPETFTLGRDMTLELRLDLAKFAQLGAVPRSLHLALTDTSGRTVVTAEVDLPADD